MIHVKGTEWDRNTCAAEAVNRVRAGEVSEPDNNSLDFALWALELLKENDRLRAEHTALVEQHKITEMSLCEAPRLVLHPHRLYRFTVAPGCALCKAEASGTSRSTPASIGILTTDETIVAARNVGVDLTCGECAALFYTGYPSAPGHPPTHDLTCQTEQFRTLQIARIDSVLCQRLAAEAAKHRDAIAESDFRGPDARVVKLAIRLVAPGPKACAVSASECHEITEAALAAYSGATADCVAWLHANLPEIISQLAAASEELPPAETGADQLRVEILP